jgi:uncharacterized protein with PQ loop repeat
MTDQPISKPTRWFWILGIAALIWNLFGVMAYIMQVTLSDEALAQLPADQRMLYETIPAWATAAFATAVFAGVLGCIALLLRKTWATPLFVLSLVGVLVQMFHAFFLTDSMAVNGPGSAAMPLLVIIIATGLVWYSRLATARGWLN